MTKNTINVTMGGKPVNLVGNEVNVGDAAPDFTATDNNLSPVGLANLKGKVLILSAVPSLDTGVCDRETRRFNEEAKKLGDDVRVVTISMDLPFAQKRWCGAAGINHVVTLSDHRDASFGKAYGVLIEGIRLLARVIFVVDRKGKVVYKQVVPEVGTEPDYDMVLSAVANIR